MQIIFEFVFDLLFEGSGMLIKNKKISLWIRVPLAIVVIALYIVIIGMLFVLATTLLINHQLIEAICIFILAVVVLVGSIYRLYKEYDKYRRKIFSCNLNE